jgi:hypothetical protein
LESSNEGSSDSDETRAIQTVEESDSPRAKQQYARRKEKQAFLEELTEGGAPAKKGGPPATRTTAATNQPKEPQTDNDQAQPLTSASLASNVVRSMKPLCTGKNDRPTVNDIKRFDYLLR